MFHFTEEQALLKDAVDGYFRDRAEGDERSFDVSRWLRLASELGVLAAPFPEAIGGAGGAYSDGAIIMEAIGENLIAQPYLEAVIMAGRVIANSFHPQRREMIQAIGTGEMLTAIAWREASSGDGHATPTLRAEPVSSGGYQLTGSKVFVRSARHASHFLVSARVGTLPSDWVLLLVRTDSDGLKLEFAPTIDGLEIATVLFDAVTVSADAVLVGPAGDALAALNDMLLAGEAALCSEALGIMRSILSQTISYIEQRKQFGSTLSSFQVLQHRVVDMRSSLEHATSLTRTAVSAIDACLPDAAYLVSAARLVTDDALGKVSRDAVQMHGAIGTMEETPISRYFKRAIVLRSELRGREYHLNVLTANIGATVPRAGGDDDLVGRVTASGTADIETFRSEVRDFLSSELTPDIREKAAWETGSFAKADLTQPWTRALNTRGWAAPGWPVEYGGPGWTPRQRQVFEEEIAREGTPRLPAMSFAMAGPVIMRFGTDEQKARFLPSILNGDDYWCQGFSETGAGSDLASLQLRADRDGDEYVLNGSKIWTTYAQFANWIFVLARTRQAEKKQQGISFLLVPMDAPGIVVTPLVSMSGEHEVNQIFFDDVRIPVANLVGPEHEGWTVAKYLLEFERGVGHQVQALIVELARLREIGQGEGLWDQIGFRRRYAELEARTLAIRLTEERLVYSLPSGENVGDFTASLMKLAWSEMGQEIDELLREALGPLAMIDQSAAVEARDAALVVGPSYGATAIRRYLDNRVLTIAGGTSEVQRMILAKLILTGKA